MFKKNNIKIVKNEKDNFFELLKEENIYLFEDDYIDLVLDLIILYLSINRIPKIKENILNK